MSATRGGDTPRRQKAPWEREPPNDDPDDPGHLGDGSDGPPEVDGFDHDIDGHALEKVRWRWSRLHDWADRDVADREWIVPGWIPRLQATGVYGVGGVNKTDLMIQMLLCRSAGLSFLGFDLEPSPVLGLFCEDTEEEIIRRASRIAQYFGMTLADFPDFNFVSLVGHDQPEFVQFNRNEMVTLRALKMFDKKLKSSGAQLAVLDTAPHFFGGNEIDRREVSRFIRKLDGVSITRRCAVVFTAHPSQSGRRSGRMDSGSTGWEGSVRARLSLSRPEEDGEENSATDERILTLRKSNYAAPGKELRLTWRDGVFALGATAADAAVPRSGEERDQACNLRFMELLDQVTLQGAMVMNRVQQTDTYAPDMFAKMCKTFSKGEFRRAMDRLWAAGRIQIATSGPPSKQKRHLIPISLRGKSNGYASPGTTAAE